jgi:hypothetical protein
VSPYWENNRNKERKKVLGVRLPIMATVRFCFVAVVEAVHFTAPKYLFSPLSGKKASSH